MPSRNVRSLLSINVHVFPGFVLCVVYYFYSCCLYFYSLEAFYLIFSSALVNQTLSHTLVVMVYTDVVWCELRRVFIKFIQWTNYVGARFVNHVRLLCQKRVAKCLWLLIVWLSYFNHLFILKWTKTPEKNCKIIKVLCSIRCRYYWF